MNCRVRVSAVLLVCAMAGLTGCQRQKSPGPLHLPQEDGSVRAIPAEVVRRGLVVYRQHCSACHGDDGRGPPPGGQFLSPRPRAFTQGLFKFGDVPAGELPRDEALMRTVRRGLHGTAMVGWALPEDDLYAVVQAIKTFSPRWREEPVGAPLEVSDDPWEGREAEARTRGEAVYHVVGAGHAGCSTCHAAYLPYDAIAARTEAATGQRPRAFAPDLYEPTPRPSDYARTLDAAGEPVDTLPVIVPDFLSDRLKTVWPVGRLVDGTDYTWGMQREDLYRVIAGGVGGTSMPTWKGALSEADLWALAYYVQSLVQQRGTPEAEALRHSLAAQPPWEP